MKYRFPRPSLNVPDGSPLLALAAGISLLPLVEGVGYGTPGVPAIVLSLFAGRRMARLRHAQVVFAGAAVAGLLTAVALGGLGGWVTLWISVLLVQFGTVLLPWWAGSWWRQRAELVRAGWERADQLQREKVLAAEQARLRERARIAQDMHDSLGHELSLMALMAGGLELDPGLDEAHRETVARLRSGAVAATDRLHEIIGLLGEASPGAGAVEPAGESIVALVRRAQSSGVPVVLEESGGPPEEAEDWWSPATRHAAARRVVQESLTNAVKHAPGARITVRVRRSAEETVVSVTNGPPPSPSGGAARSGRSGTGLISLDERVRLAGGTLTAGPGEDGFEVVARLPRVPPPAAPDQVPDAPGELRQAQGRARRHLLRASAVPLGVGGVLVVVLIGLYVYTVLTTSLEPSDFERLRPGQPRAEFADVLPQSVENPSPLLEEPPVPPGAACEYYRADDNVLDLSESMYRLCFEDEVLVAKDTLSRR
ncbi:histidine kinase [Streptomyces litchfieldiae]|uniref:histidine kinase n=1 Tax=Streptomyces litchfieldiae TaxID=3075543 RepID=A0ABU2MK20_9ACTN|nr:histidine kinase [Streptomyces sp. DSM 44938]MDT0341787.1 histidine kinase [Streptomyces sp. DSM 44938]